MVERVSTLKGMLGERPAFPLGKVCGVNERIQDNPNERVEGGLRTRGRYKRSTKEKPLVTYLTVVKNNAKTVSRCMESVWNQTYDNIEYIVVDGLSNDGTLNIIQQHADFIDYYISEPDTGIYNAMNKALSLASGEIINILNADDYLEGNAAEEVVSIYKNHPFDFLAGAGNVYNPEGSLAFPWFPREVKTGALFFGMPVMHTAIYATRNCYEITGGYDDSYTILADFKWVVMVAENNLKIERTNSILSHFTLGGTSSNKKKDMEERFRLIKERFPFLLAEEVDRLYTAMDVTLLWQSPESPKRTEYLNDLLKKYGHEPVFLRSVAEALLMQQVELKTIYTNRSEQTRTKSGLLAVLGRYVKR